MKLIKWKCKDFPTLAKWTYNVNKSYFDKFCYNEKMVTLIRVDLNEIFMIFQI